MLDPAVLHGELRTACLRWQKKALDSKGFEGLIDAAVYTALMEVANAVSAATPKAVNTDQELERLRSALRLIALQGQTTEGAPTDAQIVARLALSGL